MVTRLFDNLVFKISIIIILVEVVILTITGFFYIERFNAEIDERIKIRAELPGRLIDQRLLNLLAVTDEDMMRELVGEELVDRLVVDSNGNVVQSVDSSEQGKKVSELPRLDPAWFDESVTEARLETLSDGLVSITPVRSLTDEDQTSFFVYIKMGIEEAERQKTAVMQLFVVGSLLTVIITSVAIILLFNSVIAARINGLLDVLRRFESGDLQARVEEPISSDQIGVLQHGFNSMAQQLYMMIETLEEQVQERTRELRRSEAAATKRATELETVAQVSAATATILDTTELLQNVVDLTKERFGLYHVHIYLLDENSGDRLVLTAGAGDVGQQMVAEGWQIPLEAKRSLVARVARTRQGEIINDVRQDPNWLPNAKLPNTYAELAVPLIVGGQLMGVMDVQAEETDYFLKDDVRIQSTLASQIAAATQNARLFEQINEANAEIQNLNEKLKQENLRMSAELDVTRRLQEMVLPGEEELQAIAGLDIAGYMSPADEVGGDYYDVLQQSEGFLAGIGDVTGHGLESGVLMLMTQTAVRTLVEHGETDLQQILATLNRTLYHNIQRTAMNKMLTFAAITYRQQQLKLVGYHEEMIVVRANGSVELVNTVDLGTFMGLEPEISVFLAEETVILEPNDGVVLYTDGITEAENEARELYGLQRLCNVVSRHWINNRAADIAQMVMDELEAYIGNQTVYDDITLLVIKQK